jgi:hypothetical protein
VKPKLILLNLRANQLAEAEEKLAAAEIELKAVRDLQASLKATFDT